MNKPVPDNAIEIIRNIGANGLPDNPSRNGFGAKQVKNAINRPSTTLADWLLKTQDILVGNGIPKVVGENESLPSGSTVEEGTIVLKIVDGRLKCYVYSDNYAHEIILEEPDAFTTIQPYPAAWPVKAAKFADKALNDINGNPIASTYCPSSYIVAYATQTDGAIGTINGQIETINGQLTTANGQIDTINGQITAINTLLHSDDLTLDTVQEIVDYIKTNKNLVDYVLSAKVDKDDIVDNLTTNDATKVLSAKQGKALKDELDTKASVAGYYAGMGVKRSDVADNLVATKGLDVVNAFSHSLTGGDSSASVNDGNATINELIGVDVAENQQLENEWAVTGGDGTLVSSGDEATITANTGISGANFGFGQSLFGRIVNGHKYLVSFSFKASKAGEGLYQAVIMGDQSGWVPHLIAVPTANKYENFTYIIDASSLAGTQFFTIVTVGSTVLETGDTMSIKKNASIIDLTQRYGSNDVVNAIIGNDSSTQVANLLKFDPNILKNTAYDAGTLVSSKSAKLKSVGVNLWDEVVELVNLGGNDVISNKNPIFVFPETTYHINTSLLNKVECYDANENLLGEASYDYSTSPRFNFTTIGGTNFIKFYLGREYGTTYNHDICINFSNPSINGQYFPYEEHIVDLPDIELHGMLTVQNGKIVPLGNTVKPDGTGRGNCGLFTIPSGVTWTQFGQSYYCYFDALDSNVPSSDNSAVANAISVIGTCTNLDTIYDGGVTKAYAIKGHNLYISPDLYNDLSNIVGKTIVYEKANPTELESPSFQEFIPVKKGGTLEFLDSNGETAPLQGTDLFYQKNIKGLVEGVGSRADIDWNADNIVSKSEIYTKAELDARYALKEALGGTLRQLLAVKESLDFDDTAYVDLGDMDWTYATTDTNPKFNCQFPSAQGASDWSASKPKALCTKYKVGSWSEVAEGTNADNLITIAPSHHIAVLARGYTDATTFKAAAKGVLLAYKKA